MNKNKIISLITEKIVSLQKFLEHKTKGIDIEYEYTKSTNNRGR